MADRSRILDVPALVPRRPLRAWLDREVAALYPGCFALVMATGIISNAFFREGRRGISDVLFAVNLVAYPWLIALAAARVLAISANTGSPQLWSLVFPLGMYALATLRLSLAADFPPLRAISHAMVWVALAAWIATAAGLALASWRSLRAGPHSAEIAAS
jgi:tellurite resistance protein TehA-like permease